MKGKIYQSTSGIQTHELYNTLVADALSHCATLLENIFLKEKLLNYTWFNFFYSTGSTLQYGGVPINLNH